MTTQQIVFLLILAGAFVLLATERLRNDVVGVLIILSLAITGVLSPKEALSGVSSEAAVVVAAIFVLGAGLQHTGFSELMAGWIGRLADGGYTRAVGVMATLVALMSAFTHHVTTTALMLPVTLELSRRHGLPPSKLLMPVSFAASLGTTITIIGVPAFLIAREILQQSGRPGLGLFSLAPIGLSISAVGIAYLLTVGRWLLPSRQPRESADDRFRLTDYFTELRILPGSAFADKTITDVESDRRYQLRIVGWLRNGRRLPTAPGRRLAPGDVLLVRTTPEDIVEFARESGVDLHPLHQYGAPGVPEGEREEGLVEQLAQAVVAPDSALAGQTIGHADFRRRYGAVVVGLWRRAGWLDQELAHTRLQAGDLLVLLGDDDALRRIAHDREFLMIVPFAGQPRPRGKAWLAAAIMVATVLVAALELLTLEMATLAGAAAMVLSGCLSMGQAYRAIDSRIFVFIAGAIPLGLAMETTGTTRLVAGGLQHLVSGWGVAAILAALFLVAAAVTEFMSDAATTALLGPMAAALAIALGHAPEPYVVTVAVASVTAFLTPMAHHGNLLVYTPGGYRFSDFARVGAPLTALIAVTVILLAPRLWPS